MRMIHSVLQGMLSPRILLSLIHSLIEQQVKPINDKQPKYKKQIGRRKARSAVASEVQGILFMGSSTIEHGN